MPGVLREPPEQGIFWAACFLARALPGQVLSDLVAWSERFPVSEFPGYGLLEQ